MRKIFVLLLSVLLLVSCADSVSKSDSSTVTETVETLSITETGEVTTEANTSDESEVADDSEAEQGEAEIEDITEQSIYVGENAGQIIDLDEDVLLSNEKLELKILDVDLSHYPLNDLGPSCSFSLENKTDGIVAVGIDEVVINGLKLPTVYEEMVVGAGETSTGILPLATHHLLADVVKMGEISDITLSLYVRDEVKDYYEELEPLNFLDLGEAGDYSLEMAGLDENENAAAGLDINGVILLADRLYDNGVEIVIPFYYKIDAGDRVIVPRNASINDEKDLKCAGYQKAKAGKHGFGEAFIDKEALGDASINDLRVDFEIKNEKSGYIEKLSLLGGEGRFLER